MQQNYYKNKKSLALLGHSKLKAILPFTLLLIGLLVSMNGAWAQSYENGKLQMSKTYKPTKQDHSEGYLWLETYVTGSHFTTSVQVPTDLVLVLDMSYSMRQFNMGNISRVQALHNAVQDFLTVVFNKDIDGAGQNGVIGHRVSMIAFSSKESTALYSTNSEVLWDDITDNDCKNSLREITNSNGTINTALSTTAVNRITRNNCVIGTYAQYGLNLAYRVLDQRDVKTFTDSQGGIHDRSAIVVFFTDGYPGGSGSQGDFYYPRNEDATSNNQAYEADAAVYEANRIKGVHGTIDANQTPIVYTVGIFDAANPQADYIASWTNSNNNNYWGYYTSGTAAANGMMHMISSDYDYVSGMGFPDYTRPEDYEQNNGQIQYSTNPGYFHQHIQDPSNHGSQFFYTDQNNVVHESKYFAATSQEGLSRIFQSIASQAGSDPINMTAGTQVQDVISASFTLQGGTNVNAIEVYAVKCTGATVDGQGNVTACEFNTTGADTYPELGGGTYTYGTKTSYDGEDIQYLQLINHPGGDDHGAVDEVDAEGGNKENRLQSGQIVQIETDDDGNDQVNITGFNFKAMYCGLENGQPRGRKLVIKIPIKVKDGIWGDEFNTNGEMSLVQPDGSQTTYPFNMPITNVIGSVWTEEVTSEPAGFDPNNIDSPEDLAWFISCVNGRIYYEEGTNNVASNPRLNGRLVADIDMSAHNWVPIGAGYKCNAQGQYVDAAGQVVYKYENGVQVFDDNGNPVTEPTVKLAYEGIFDGNGHVVTGLKNNVAKYYKLAHGEQYQVIVFPGMFSNVRSVEGVEESGIVKNLFVLDADFRARNHDRERETFEHFGIIADTLTGGTIYNCEAVGSITVNDDDNFERNSIIVLGGLVGYNNGGTIHSCMAMPTLTGYTMGGMIGLNKGSFTNGFTNPVFNYLYDNNNTANQYTGKYVGGIVGDNASTGSISNCYVRFSRYSDKLDKAAFGQVAGSGNFTQGSCYTPRTNTQEGDIAGYNNNAWNNTIPNDGAATLYSFRRNPSHMRGDRSNDNMVGGVINDGILTGGTPLLTMLNSAVDTDNGESTWKRTTAGGYPTSPNGGDINGDYPVLVYEGYTCLAGNNGGIGIDYATSLDEMLNRHNNYTLNTNSNVLVSGSTDEYKYRDTEVNVLKGGAVNLFENETTSLGTSSAAGTVLYIDENVSLLQTTNAAIDAYTCQTLIDYGCEVSQQNGLDMQSGNRWHNVSSSLQNSMIGLSYEITGQVPSALGENWAVFKSTYDAANNYDLSTSDPCRVRNEQNNDDQALFPADMRANGHPFDFYCFDEPSYHWINFKRNSSSHWHMDNPLLPITYSNEPSLTPGKGYLLAIAFEYFDDLHLWAGNEGKDRTFLQNRGTLNNGNVPIAVRCTATNAWTGLMGYNLLGNPYQSYLDFDKFVTGNPDLWGGGDTYAQTYAVYDPNAGSYVQYKSGVSDGSNTAGQFINMHQGFFIQTSQTTTAYFTNAMRTNESTPNFRSYRPAYPLINFELIDGNGSKDIAVLEVGRLENDGAKKLNVGSATGRISLRHDDTDFGILFRDMNEGSQPLRFETEEDGTFTLSWNTANANFSSLTLVDNITGVKYDMLTHNSYEFEGRASDYKSRFKILIGEFTDVEENEETVTNNFAFFDGSEWVVNGKGQLMVVDMMGRTVYTGNLTNDQNRVSLNGLSQGVYLMQVRGANGTMVQKIVVR